MPLIEKRYAEALVDTAEKGSAIDEYRQELQSVVNMYNEQPDLRFLLLNPEIKTDIKKKIISELLQNEIRDELISFLKLLIDRNRVRYLPGMLDEFIRIADKRRNILNMTIISALPLDEEQIYKIREKYRKDYNASSVKVKIKIDKDVIGGVKVQVGDKVVDGSIKGRLEDLMGMLIS